MNAHLPAPEPGVYFDVPEATYHAWDCASPSRLATIFQSTPAHCRHEIENRKETPSLLLGRAVHSAILTPSLFERDFAIGPDVDRRTTAGKAQWAEFVAANGGRSLLTDEQGATVKAMVEKARGWQHLVGALKLCPRREVSLVADIDGVRVKGRLDGYGLEHEIAIDLKTTRDAGRREFERSLVTFGYAFKATVYRRLLSALKLPCSRFLYFVIESEAPHCFATYELADEVTRLYATEVDRCLATWGECFASKTWPGYPAKVETISVPDWHVRTLRIEEGVAA